MVFQFLIEHKRGFSFFGSIISFLKSYRDFNKVLELELKFLFENEFSCFTVCVRD